MTLEATPKLSTSNSYATLDQANTYHDTRLHNTDWSNAGNSDKERGLKTATRLLDGLSWDGFKVTNDQALRFPRSGLLDPDGYSVDYNTIPTFLVNAVSELAMFVIAKDITKESSDKGYKGISVGPIKLAIDKTDRKNVIPDSVIDMVKPYLRSRGTIEVMRG